MQLKAAGGHVVDIVGEVTHGGVEYYAIHYGGEERRPFLIRKDNENYTPYDLSGEPPRAGDLVAGGEADYHTRYRVLGATDTQMLIVEKADYAGGDWPVVGSEQIQKGVAMDATQVYVRRLPDGYLKVVERP